MRAIVGNGPLTAQDHQLISSAKHITRFNVPSNVTDVDCIRTDELFLSCSSKQIGDFLSHGKYKSNKVFCAAELLVLTYHPDIIRQYMPSPTFLSRLKGRRKDWTSRCLEIAQNTGKKTVPLSAEAYLDACQKLVIDPNRKDFFPSSGLLAILRAVESTKTGYGELHVFGVGFEGWKRHFWPREKQIVSTLATQGKLTLHTNTS